MKISAICILTIISIFLLGYSHAISERPECTGWPFLRFSIKKPDGSKFSSAAIRNKIVFATFWRESSPTCIEEITAFNKMYERLKDSANFIFVSFTTDDDSTIKKIVAYNNIKYNLLHMNYKQCDKINYGHGFPSSFILDKNGTIVFYRPQLVYGKEIDVSEIMTKFYPKILELL